MTSSVRRRVLRLGVLLALFGAPASAQAQAKPEKAEKAEKVDKKACIDAFEEAQRLRRDGKLAASQKPLAVCATRGCPSLVRQECTKWSTEVQASLGSVVLAARDATGRDLTDVKVTVDGVPLTERLEGKPLPLDPGPHVVRFEAPGRAPVEERLTLKDGERNRTVTVVLAAAAAATAGDDGKGAVAQGGAPSQSGALTLSPSSKVVPYTLVGLGGAALVTSLVLDLSATSSAHDLRETCAGHCRQEDVDAVSTRYTLAAVLAGVGAISAGVGVYLLVKRPAASTKTGAHVELRSAGTGAVVRGVF